MELVTTRFEWLMPPVEGTRTLQEELFHKVLLPVAAREYLLYGGAIDAERREMLQQNPAMGDFYKANGYGGNFPLVGGNNKVAPLERFVNRMRRHGKGRKKGRRTHR